MRSPFARSLSAFALLGLLLFVLPACDWSWDGHVDEVFAEAEANVGEWTFIDVPGLTCRDGSATGFGVRLQEDAENLAIYFEGGGACFNALTCALNPSRFDEGDFAALVAARGDAGLFSPAADNPVGAWNQIYVPYCTGDVHGGNAPDAVVPGVNGVQQFVGHRNVERSLALIAPYFGDPDRVLVTGASAGGFGALLNFAAVADRFPDSERVLLDDSGPAFFADDVFSPALGSTFADLYAFAGTLPDDAGALFEPDGLQGIYAYYDARYPDATFGVSSYLEDQVIRFFFGFGQADGQITAGEYAAGLRDLRDHVPASWGTYFASGPRHTFLGDDDRYFGTSAGVSLNDWLDSLLDGQPSDVDPALATVAAR